MDEDKVASLQQQLDEARQKLSRTERQLQKSESYNEDLRQQIESMSSELHAFRSSLQNRKEAACQVAEKDISQAYGEKPFPSWSGTHDGELEQDAEGQTESGTSIADSLKAAAEEFVWNEAGFVYDSSSGLYYDYNSGYYYDPVHSLYYDPSTTAYYYYDETEKVHKFHSYASGQYDQQISECDIESSTAGEGMPIGASGQQNKKEKRSSDRHRKEDREKRKAQKRTDLVSRRTRSSKHKSKTREKKRKKKDMERGSKDRRRRSSNSSSIIFKDSDSEERTEQLCDVKNMSDVIVVDSSDSLATGESEMLSDPVSLSGDLSNQSSEAEENKTEDKTHLGGKPVLYHLTEEHITEPEVSASYPPCVRVIVQESDTLEAGTFFLVTCPGGTLGRDKDPNHAIQIQEINVSKIHAEIMYDYDNTCYTVKDMGSQNGTFINGLRICESKERSAAVPVEHGDILQVGSTRMLLHIHPGSDTCDSCEPGQVLAALRAQQTVSKEHVIMTNAEKKKQAQEQLKNIKKKYGLGNSAYVDNVAAIKNPDYADKAQLRRRFIGSTHTSHKESMGVPASVHRPIPSENKGHRMLSRMGWEEGSGLGKDNTGRAEPVAVELRANQTAGLGSTASVGVSLDNVQTADKTRRRLQAQARYQSLENPRLQQHTDGNDHTLTAVAGDVNESGETQSLNSVSGELAKYQMRWVKGVSWKPP